jgi:hypothetical protein
MNNDQSNACTVPIGPRLPALGSSCIVVALLLQAVKYSTTVVIVTWRVSGSFVHNGLPTPTTVMYLGTIAAWSPAVAATLHCTSTNVARSSFRSLFKRRPLATVDIPRCATNINCFTRTEPGRLIGEWIISANARATER